jgi:hypothetical protein
VEFSSVTRIAVPVDAVWPIMTDHERYVKWTPARRVELVTVGAPGRNGLGAVRKFHAGPMSPYERVVAFEPPQGEGAARSATMVYVLDKGLPIKGYRSTMELVADGDSACVLTWSSSFTPRIPGTGAILRRILSGAVDTFAQGIRIDAEAGAVA